MNEKVILLTFLDKLMFWKKKEEPIPDLPYSENKMSFGETDFNKHLGMESDMGDMGLEHEAPGVPSKPIIPFTRQKPVNEGGMDRDTELILAKLDAVKAKMESIDARLAHIEKIAEK